MLPDEILEIIYKLAHKSKLNESLSYMNKYLIWYNNITCIHKPSFVIYHYKLQPNLFLYY